MPAFPVILVSSGGIPVTFIDPGGGSGTTGSGLVVLNNAPTLINPIVGTQTAGDNSTKAASTAYVDVNHARILGNLGTGWPLTGTTSKTTLVTVAVPAGLMGTNGKLRIQTLWSFTNSANNKILNVDFGGTSFTTATATTTATGQIMTIIQNNNATGSQNAFASSASFGLATNSINGGSVDTTAAQNITIAGTLANSGETITLRGYSIEFLPGV